METIVHFGAGALGRGLVIPMLVDSEKEVVAVDTNEELLNQLKREKGYRLHISDDRNNPYPFISLKNALDSIKEKEKVIEQVRNANVVTTSVRRQNLKYVAPIIVEAWKKQDCRIKQVICCENVENVGTIFKELLENCMSNKEELINLNQIRVPNTIVDRICAMDSKYNITSELFRECSVDAKIDPNTGLKNIDSIDNLIGNFYRKRYLMNSYADSVSYCGLGLGFSYLYEATRSEKANEMVNSSILLYYELLEKKYSISKQESKRWFDLYRKRLSNPYIPRELNTVARSLWHKLTLTERFVCPLIELKELGIDVTEGLKTIATMIDIDNKVNNCNYSKEQIALKLKDLWTLNETGKLLYNEMVSIM